MKITKRQLRRIIKEEAAKSTEKYDDDSALKGDQDDLPDKLQKGIIDKTVEDREEREEEEREEQNESMRITRRQLRRIIREELAASHPRRKRLDVHGDPISSMDPEAYRLAQQTIIKPGLDPDEQSDYDEIEYERGYQDGLQDYVKNDDELPDYYAGYDAGKLDADLPETDWRASRSEDW